MWHNLLCSSRKYSYSPHRRDWYFLGVVGFWKAKKFKEMYEDWLEFPSVVGYGYFLELHIVCYIPVAFGAHSTQTSRPAWLKLLDRCFLIVGYWVMLSMDGRPSSRPFRAFFFLRNICIQAQKQRLEGYTYVDKIILMFMEIGPPFALFQSKWGLCIQFKFCWKRIGRTLSVSGTLTEQRIQSCFNLFYNIISHKIQ